jgi:hypothetical protein
MPDKRPPEALPSLAGGLPGKSARRLPVGLQQKAEGSVGRMVDGVRSFRLLPVTMTGALMRSCGKRRRSFPFRKVRRDGRHWRGSLSWSGSLAMYA